MLEKSPESTKLKQLLKSRFHLDSFRIGQEEVILSLVNGHDAIAVMPTGGGKSLCYQLPSVYRKGIVVVVSPLIALMKDQVRGLQTLKIRAGCLHSGQSLEEKQTVFSEMRSAESYILYVSPERVQKPGFAEWAKKQDISAFAIDEAHCISQWGPDFRPDYSRLNLLRSIRPEIPILALTASATPEVLKDIVKQLELKKPDQHIHGFYRPNLYYQVEICPDTPTKIAWLRQALLQTPRGRILIYCGTRKQCEGLTTELGTEFPDMGFYHAGMSSDERTRIQKDYETGKLRILAATNAFGMGVDHPDVRLVTHFQMPSHVESLYQEMGRAGRDGKDSTCLLLYSKKDKGLHSYFIQQSEASKAILNRRWRALDIITQFAEGGECRHSGILTYFRDSFRLKACGHCDICDPDSGRRVQPPEIAKPAKKGKKILNEVPLGPREDLRMEVLREWRKAYADGNDIPAFLVFSNKTLRDLAVRAPTTLPELEKVYGFGPHKVEHLGALVLAKLAET